MDIIHALMGFILFSHKTITLPRAEVSRLRARPKGFPIALWKPSGLSPCCYVFIAEQYDSFGFLFVATGHESLTPQRAFRSLSLRFRLPPSADSPLASRRPLETFGVVPLLLCFYCRTGLVSFATAATHRGGIATEQSIMAGPNFTADASALQAIPPALRRPVPAGRLRQALADIPPHRAAPSRPRAYRKREPPEKDNSRR